MKFQYLKEQFASNSIDKAEFIQSASQLHEVLFSYPEIVAGSEINEIRIDHKGLAFQVGSEGLWLRCPSGESRVAPLEIMNFGSYEPEETSLMLSLISDAKVVLDIGANIGWFSLVFARGAPQADIHAFEPIPLFNQYLQENIALNGLEGRVFAHQFGFSDDCKSVEYFVDVGNGTNASMRNVADSKTAQVLRGEVVTLDHWASENAIQPDFIKCDVEGAEYLVMKGAKGILASVRPMVFLEMLRKWAKPYGYSPNDIIEFFAKLSYLCCGVSEKGSRLVNHVGDETVETNYLFLHRDNHIEQIASLRLSG